MTFCEIGGMRLYGDDRLNEDELFVTLDGIDGWYSTPDTKVSMTERQTADGAHDVQDGMILYSARTVTVSYLARGDNRTEVLEQLNRLLSLVHENVTIRVSDEGSDTFCEGYVAVTSDATWSSRGLEGTVTVVCPRPERLSTFARNLTLLPTAGVTSGGLMWHDPGKEALLYPLQFGKNAATVQNYGTIVNDGTSRAYPVITVNGPFDSVRVDVTVDGATSTIQYDGYVGVVPLVLDFRTRTASMDSLDVSRNLTLRGFRPIPPGGSMGVSLQSVGTGWIEVEVRDTYI